MWGEFCKCGSAGRCEYCIKKAQEIEESRLKCAHGAILVDGAPINCLRCRIAELEAKLGRLEKAIAIAAMNLPCSTEQCQLDVKAGLQAALEEKGDD